MFARITKITSVSSLTLALIATSIPTTHAVDPNDDLTALSSHSLNLSLEGMESDQRPAPVYGEDKQVIDVGGIDTNALPKSIDETHEQHQTDTLDSSEPSEESRTVPTENQNHEDKQQENNSETLHPEAEEDDQSRLGRPKPESAQSSPSSAAPTSTPQNPQSAEEERLAQTAVENTENELAALTMPIESIDFVAAGLTWDSNTAESITDASIRVREQGEWTQWHDLEIHATDEEMRAHSPRAGTEPLITLEADAVQARIHTVSGDAPDGLELSLIDPGESATDGQLKPASLEHREIEPANATSYAPRTQNSRDIADSSTKPSGEQALRHTSASRQQANQFVSAADVIKPAIVTRAQWGANESLASNSNQSKELKAMYVHHTAGTNNYTRAQAYAQIRSIYRFHTESLRWGDIGYNFLIDRYGTIYEGRRGSIDSLPVGAQAGGFNTDTFGISTMGNFETARPPAVMVESLKQVLSWKGLQHGINATGTTRLTSAGGTSKYSYGTQVNVNTILGHRDTHATACPGQYLYSQLPTIRRDVASRIDNASAGISDIAISINPGYTYRAQKDTILRAQPNSTSNILQRLPNGTSVTTTNLATTTGWWRVTINGTTGWVPPQDIVYYTRYNEG